MTHFWPLFFKSDPKNGSKNDTFLACLGTFLSLPGSFWPSFWKVWFGPEFSGLKKNQKNWKNPRKEVKQWNFSWKNDKKWQKNDKKWPKTWFCMKNTTFFELSYCSIRDLCHLGGSKNDPKMTKMTHFWPLFDPFWTFFGSKNHFFSTRFCGFKPTKIKKSRFFSEFFRYFFEKTGQKWVKKGSFLDHFEIL